MPLTYSDHSSKLRSEKIMLCHVEPVQKLVVFTLDSGAIYKKSVNYFVIDVKEDNVSLTEASSSSLNSGEWYFDNENGEIYVRTTDDTDPKTHEIVVTYRLFYSNKPIDLPYDLTSGAEVNYDGRIRSNSPITRSLDDEQIGITLESSTTVDFENTDGHFDEFFDTLIFENKNLTLYSWSETLQLSEKKKLFEGQIQDKSFSQSSVKFRCKDFVYKLRKPVVTSFFSSSDGDVPERFLNTPKRRLFGRFKQLQCVPIDAIKDGFSVTGTVSGASNQAIVTGSGTAFLDELSPDDEIIFNDGNENYKFSILTVDSDTQITLDSDLTITLGGDSITCLPKRAWRKKNRSWHIAGHKLRAPSTTVSSAVDARRFIITDVSDIFQGDLISVDGEDAFVQRISSDDVITLTANLQGGEPADGVSVTKNPLSAAYVNGSEIFITRDWTVTNGASDAILVLDETTERNIATTRALPSSNITFTNGSRSVTVTDINFLDEVQTRDWIRSDDSSHTTWYEVLRVEELTITLRVVYGGNTQTSSGDKKNITPIDDNAIVTVNCLGQERSSAWVGNAAEAVKDMLENDIGATNINTSSFTTAGNLADYPLSIAIPSKIGGRVELVRDIISKINKSVFGSLVVDSDFNLSYDILTPDRPESLTSIKDDDIITFSVETKNETIRKVNAKYSPFTDKFNGDDAFELYEFTNDFADNLTEAKAELDIDIYLFDLKFVEGIAQRWAIYNSLAQSTVKIKGKLNLVTNFLNDKVYIEFDRIFKRFGNADKRKIGIVSKVSNDGLNVNLEINDLGNTFNRVGAITPSSANEFTSASSDEKIKNGFIVDTTTELVDTTDDTNTFTNLIG